MSQTIFLTGASGGFGRLPANADLRPAGEGYVIFERSRFQQHVAADLPKSEAEFLAASQTPSAVSAFAAKVSAAPWRDKPSYAVVATEDRSVRPELQRFMYSRSRAKVIEVKASHLVHMSHPRIVANLIKRAARDMT